MEPCVCPCLASDLLIPIAGSELVADPVREREASHNNLWAFASSDPDGDADIEAAMDPFFRVRHSAGRRAQVEVVGDNPLDPVAVVVEHCGESVALREVAELVQNVELAFFGRGVGDVATKQAPRGEHSCGVTGGAWSLGQAQRKLDLPESGAGGQTL